MVGWSTTTGSGDIVAASMEEAYSGIWSVKTYTDGDGDNRSYIFKTVPDGDEYWIRSFIYFKHLPDDPDEQIRLMKIIAQDGTSVQFCGVSNQFGSVKWFVLESIHGGGYTYAATGPVVDTWYSVEIRVVQGDVNGSVSLYVNNILVASLSGIDTWGGTFINTVCVGQLYSSVGDDCIIYFDDICYASTQVGYESTTTTSTTTTSTSTTTTSTSTTITSTSTSTSTTSTSTTTSTTTTTTTAPPSWYGRRRRYEIDYYPIIHNISNFNERLEGVYETRRYLEFLVKALNVVIPEEEETHYEETEEEEDE